MDSLQPIRQASLTDQVFDILMTRIKDHRYPHDNRLPPENQLAEEFNVSRATVRSALDMLAVNGLIVRRQGIGTFVSRLALIANPINQFIDFNDLIGNNNFTPGFRHINSEIINLDEDIAVQLSVNPGTEAMKVEKVFTADGKPIIYCVNYIPKWIFENKISNHEVEIPSLTEPYFSFFENTCNQHIEYYRASIHPEIYRDCPLPDILAFDDPYTPVLVIEEIGYNDQEEPVIFEIEYHPGNVMRFELIRYRNRG